MADFPISIEAVSELIKLGFQDFTKLSIYNSNRNPVIDITYFNVCGNINI